MPWKLVPSDDPNDLTDSELVGISVRLNHAISYAPIDDTIGRRAWEKIQPQVNIAIERGI